MPNVMALGHAPWHLKEYLHSLRNLEWQLNFIFIVTGRKGQWQELHIVV